MAHSGSASFDHLVGKQKDGIPDRALINAQMAGPGLCENVLLDQSVTGFDPEQRSKFVRPVLFCLAAVLGYWLADSAPKGSIATAVPSPKIAFDAECAGVSPRGAHARA
jgi:hypothetical protein